MPRRVLRRPVRPRPRQAGGPPTPPPCGGPDAGYRDQVLCDAPLAYFRTRGARARGGSGRSGRRAARRLRGPERRRDHLRRAGRDRGRSRHGDPPRWHGMDERRRRVRLRRPGSLFARGVGRSGGRQLQLPAHLRARDGHQREHRRRVHRLQPRRLRRRAVARRRGARGARRGAREPRLQPRRRHLRRHGATDLRERSGVLGQRRRPAARARSGHLLRRRGRDRPGRRLDWSARRGRA
jgi:hypothetical protein